jgi:hypothetical protein
MTLKLIARTLSHLLRLGTLVAVVTGATVASAWSSKHTFLSDDVHSKAIDRVFAKLSQRQRDLLKQAQTIVDADQDAGQSAEHAMTGIESEQDIAGKQLPIYVQRSEAALRCWLFEALDLAAAGDNDQAMLTLGRAVAAGRDVPAAPALPGLELQVQAAGKAPPCLPGTHLPRRAGRTRMRHALGLRNFLGQAAHARALFPTGLRARLPGRLRGGLTP